MIGMTIGTVAMGILGGFVNYYIMIPFYINQMNFPAEAVIGSVSGVIPAVDSMIKLIMLVTVPFNLLKGVVLSVLCLLMYKRLSGLLHAKK